MAVARCACGFTKFATRVDKTTDAFASRWRPVPTLGGLGSTPMGATLATGQQGWGRFVMPVTRGIANTFCLSCQRLRRGLLVGGGTAMISYVDNDAVYAVMTDVVEPACMSAQFLLANGEGYISAIETPEDVLPALLGSPAEVRAVPPYGAVLADRLYRIPYPEVRNSGLYRITLIDRCLETRQVIGNVILEGDLDLYHRIGDVVAEFGDYAASQIVTDESGTLLADDLDALQDLILDRAAVSGDLGGSSSAPKVVGLQGYAVQDASPADAAILTWSSANNRWEPKV